MFSARPAAARAGLFGVALLATLLVAEPLQAQCATPDPTDLSTLDLGVTHRVRAVYFAPADRPLRSCVDEHLDTFIRLAQDFFSEEMASAGYLAAPGQGKTFDYETGPDGRFEVVYMTGDHDAAWYTQQGGNAWDAAFDEMYQRLPAAYHNNNVVIYIYDLWVQSGSGLDHTGQAGSGAPWEGDGAGYTLQGSHFLGTDFDTLATDPAGQPAMFEQGGSSGLRDYDGDGNLTILTRGQYASTYVGAAMHELGHAFYLGHDFTDYDGDGIETNLMGNGFRRLSGRYTSAGYQPPTRLGTQGAADLDTATMFGGDRCGGASVVPDAISAAASASGGTLSVTSPASCFWSAATEQDWIQLQGDASGSGNGEVAYSLLANPSSEQRVGSITVAGQTVSVTQAGAAPCSYTIDPEAAEFDAGGGSGAVDLDTEAHCDWSATSNDAWIELDESATGTGPGRVDYSVRENSGALAREGSITVAGLTHSVTQAPVAVCAYAVEPTEILVDSGTHGGTVTVTTGSGCDWTASSAEAWIVIDSSPAGSGSGSVEYTIQANSGSGARVGSLTIAGITVRVEQTAPPTTVSVFPAEIGLTSSEQTGSIEVQAAAGRTWEAESDAPWLEVVSAASGTGAGAVEYRVAANPADVPRSGILRIDEESVDVRQDGAGPTALTPAAAGQIRSDGREELILLGRESRGPARGFWLQGYGVGGNRFLSRFPGNVGMMVAAVIDVDGDGRGEIITLEAGDQGLTLVVRNGKGRPLAVEQLPAGAVVRRLALFELDIDGDGRHEVGFGYQDDSSAYTGTWAAAADRTLGNGSFPERLAGSVDMQQLGDLPQTGWQAGDVDGDGDDDIVVTYAASDSSGARFRVVDPASGAIGKPRRVAGTKVAAAGWLVDDFVSSNPGVEILCATRSRRNGAVALDVRDSAGRKLSGRTALSADADDLTVRAIRTPGASGNDAALLVYRVGSEVGFSTWSFERRRAKQLGGANVLDDARVEAVLTGDFDADPVNGHEIALLFTDMASHAIRAQLWARTGVVKLGNATLLTPEWMAPAAIAAAMTNAEAHELAIVARTVTGTPMLSIWEITGAGQLRLQRQVFNADTR